MRRILRLLGGGAGLCVLAAALTAAAQQGKKGPMAHKFAGPAPAHPFDIVLVRPTETSMTVSVLAYGKMEGYLTFAAEGGELTARTETRTFLPETPVEFVLKGLRPNTRYRYRLQHRDARAEEFKADVEHSFHTRRAAGSTFVFTMQADSHLDQNTRTAVYERTLANALADHTDFHIDLGDTFMTDKYEKYRDALPHYLAQRYYLGQLGHSAPLFFVLGNHDGERLDRFDGTADSMPAWSCQMRRKLFPNPFPDGFYTGNRTELQPMGRLENYYAWEWGDALLIVLDPFWTTSRRGGKKGPDSNWTRTLGKEQFDWFKETLAGSKAKFKFVFIHHLVGGLDESARGGSEAAELYEWGGKNRDGKNEFADRRPGWEAPIHALLVKYGAAAVFHGHDHFFARQELDGIVYQLVPQPGHPGFDKVRNAEEYGYLRGNFLPPAGHLRVTVTPARATVEYVRSYLPRDETATRRNGEVAFRYTLRPREGHQHKE